MNLTLPILISKEDIQDANTIEKFDLDENDLQIQRDSLDAYTDDAFDELYGNGTPLDSISTLNLPDNPEKDHHLDYLTYNLKTHNLIFDDDFIQRILANITSAKQQMIKENDPAKIVELAQQKFNNRCDDQICIYSPEFFEMLTMKEFVANNYKNKQYNNYKILGFMNYHI